MMGADRCTIKGQWMHRPGVGITVARAVQRPQQRRSALADLLLQGASYRYACLCRST